MIPNSLKAPSLFVAGGLISGSLVYVAPFVLWGGVGFLFLTALAASAMAAHKLGLLSTKSTGARYSVAALIIATSYPIAFWLILLPVASRIPENQNALCVDLALVLAGEASATLLALALRVVTRRWDKRVLRLMLAAPVVAILITSGASWLLDVGDSIPFLF